jgi:hypothetical protein
VDWDPLKILDSYQSLLEVEDNFKMLKGPIKLRPMLHRASRRIRAHATICMLSLMVLRQLEHLTKLNYTQLVSIFNPVHATSVEQGDVRFWQRNEWCRKAEEILGMLKIDPGPVTWGVMRVNSTDDGQPHVPS